MMKRLIICCDGTWNRADQEDDRGEPIPTNVVRIAYRVAPADAKGQLQIVYYDQGVGTGNKADHVAGGLTGAGMEENIFAAYRFLIANYVPGDEIFLFGFSRGAYTARSIAGLVRNSGILRRTKIRQYKEAINLYLDRGSHPSDKTAELFRLENSVSEKTPIKMIGVWDTVGARGIPARGLNKLTTKKYEFHDTTLSASVEYAYHALAIDEHRGPFEATLWTNEPKPLHHDGSRKQTIEQVWFCGAHSDVGGGYQSRQRPSLSDISLQWMIDRATGAGLAFDPDVLKEYGLTIDCCAEIHDSYTWKYKLSPRITRTIGGTQTEYVHQSALTRWEKPLSPEYRPKSFVALGRIQQWLARSPRQEIERV